jgi:hypothetical protein
MCVFSFLGFGWYKTAILTRTFAVIYCRFSNPQVRVQAQRIDYSVILIRYRSCAGNRPVLPKFDLLGRNQH